MDVAHEHSHGLVRCQRHADPERHARIGNVRRRAVADAVGADLRHTGTVKDAPPRLIVGVEA